MASDHSATPGATAARRRRSTSTRTRQSHLLPQKMHHLEADEKAVIHVGWGRLIFAHTFPNAESLVEELAKEAPDERDIAFYVEDPHVAVAAAPQSVFLDPSHTYRLWLTYYKARKRRPRGFIVRRLWSREDAREVNRILASQHMVQVPADFLINNSHSRRLTYLVAEDENSGRIVGTVMGVDHFHGFSDPENGSSLWCLAVDAQSAPPGVGESLVRQLAEHYKARGRAFLDLSVMHDNEPAITLYEHLGFQRVQLFTLKTKTPINETLFIAPQPDARLNPYARIIINEARRRGITVEIEDEEAALFRLSLGGRVISCREALSDLTSSVTLTRCDDKALTYRLLKGAGLSVAEQHTVVDEKSSAGFLERHGRIVVKPARGEQGHGVFVDVRTPEGMRRAIKEARKHCETVLLERYCEGEDLRIIVIGEKVVAAAVRRPASVRGNGTATIAELIEVQSRRRAAATGGESRVPLDDETERCIEEAGYTMDSMLPEGETLVVRKTANLHTGGTIHDVTGELHPELAAAAVKAARTLHITVVGFDFLVNSPAEPDYVIIEANERPGLANHEPQPTAERFIDLLFPQTVGEVT